MKIKISFLLCLGAFFCLSFASGQERPMLEDLLKEEENQYFATLDGDELDLCCYELLDISENIAIERFENETQIYDTEEGSEEVQVFRSNRSFIIRYFNDHPEVNRTDLVSGQIFDFSLIRNQTISAPPTKTAFLARFFVPSDIFQDIRSVTIYEDAMADAWTTYIFLGEELTEIRFDSSYDWIEKEFSDTSATHR